ncbi:hypothetical protein G647_00942 [Cladophialophora carrionii CBS 160.54]|uniref:Uncharacterized protein n=1 Tax=Cladophialophora carrionii CBS 160.54 TaxID=1279043 RepID=V9DQB5_9EURO|nr:uncharacterized protein G647_00942 [Cladophialophora carrionii CBS 160.54]ETI28493.1 hypothetical protein G647_00942 [Cladophialophora carrionii CBS 160.54]
MNTTATDSAWVHVFAGSYRAFSTATTILSYAFYPIVRLLALLWYILASLSSPFIYLAGVVIHIASIPWRIFAAFEPLWYFLGSAVFIGLLLALILHFTLRAIVFVFRIDKQPTPKPIPPKGHDAISYRKAREEKRRRQLEEQQRLATQARLMASQPLLQEVVREARKMPLTTSTGPLSPVSPTNTLPARPGLLQETILEHSEEDDDDSVF